MDLKESDILGGAIADHWYYRSKAKALMHFIGDANVSSILDVGAGSGFFSRYLLSNSTAKEAWCVDTSYDCDFDSVEGVKPIHFRRSVGAIEANLVLLMDVLEHVDDDVDLLRQYGDKVSSGTIFLISVPAFQFLWSEHDVFLEHKRRYRLEQIESVAERAGLKVIQGAYYFGAVFPVAAVLRLRERVFRRVTHEPRSQLKQHHLVTNEVLAAISHMELPFMSVNRIAGLTAFCLAECR